MKKITFIADGKTKDFYFNFPFFLKSNVIITLNNEPATKYNLICIKNELNADIPFAGGRVQFARPPKQNDVITIYRNLPIERFVDYQPTAVYNPTQLNQDMNYMLELLKDTQDNLDYLINQPSESVNAESIEIISQQITQIVSAIAAINERIDQINISDVPDLSDDISEINTSIQNLTTAVNALTTNVNENASVINAMQGMVGENSDYVVEQHPATGANNIWIRKYKSGWVEMGGFGAKGETIKLPITMRDTTYGVLTTLNITHDDVISYSINIVSKTVSSFKIRSESSVTKNAAYWMVFGFAQTSEQE